MKTCTKCGKETEKGKFCVYCGEKLKNSNLKFIFITISLIIIIIVLSVIIGFLINSNKDLKQDYKNLNSRYNVKQKSYENIKSEKEKLEKKADFLDWNVVFVLDGYGNYYYTYDQMMDVTAGKDYSFWAYNIEAAKGRGYTPYKTF